MQKLDFVQAIEKVYKDMSSESVVSDIDISTTPGYSKYGTELAVQLFDMYSNYKGLRKDERYAHILKALNGDELFDAENVAKLFQLFQGDIGRIDFIENKEFRSFLDFHLTLKGIYDVTKKLLIKDKVIKSLKKEGSDGMVVFQISIDSDGLPTKVYIEILKAIETLVTTIQKIYGEEVIESNIILLDSGSDTNLGIDTTVKAATGIFSLFKQIYDFIIYRGNDKIERNNVTIMSNLNILSEIQKKVDDNIISSDDGMSWAHSVKSSLNVLLGYDVIPKELNQLEGVNPLHLLNRGPIGLLQQENDTGNEGIIEEDSISDDE